MVDHLQGRVVPPGTTEYGAAFETFIPNELVCRRDYDGLAPLSYWQSTSGFEVHFLVGDRVAIEVKAKNNVSPRDLRSLHALADEGVFRRYVCVALEPAPRRVGNIEILPLSRFLADLWSGALNA